MSKEINLRQFRKVMGLFPTGVSVVATQSDGEIHAMTANAITSVSLDPLLVLVCVGKRARLAEFLAQEVGFSINFLREDQQALSTFFAGTWDEASPPPFRFVAWGDKPRLEGCLAALGCECFKTVEGGDHWVVIGRVVALHQGIAPHRPLVFYRGRYERISHTEGEPAPDLGSVEVPMQVFYDPWRQESD